MLDRHDHLSMTRVQPRLAEQIASELREQILNGVHTSGMLPKQEDLVAAFRVSAPPLREALRILEGEGLITVKRGKVGGAIIHAPDGATVSQAIGMALQAEQVHLRDLAEAVLLFEPTCAAACARRPDRQSALQPLLQENLELSGDAVGDGPEFTHRARQFHDIVVAWNPLVTSRLVVRGLVALWSAQEEAWAHEASQIGRYPTVAEQRSVLTAHRRIAGRIMAGEADAAEHGARSHIKASQQHVLAGFGDRVVDASSPRAVRGLRDVIARQSVTQPHAALDPQRSRPSMSAL